MHSISQLSLEVSSPPPQSRPGLGSSDSGLAAVPPFFLCWIHKDLSEIPLGPGRRGFASMCPVRVGQGSGPRTCFSQLDACVAGSSLPSVLLGSRPRGHADPLEAPRLWGLAVPALPLLGFVCSRVYQAGSVCLLPGDVPRSSPLEPWPAQNRTASGIQRALCPGGPRSSEHASLGLPCTVPSCRRHMTVSPGVPKQPGPRWGQ